MRWLSSAVIFCCAALWPVAARADLTQLIGTTPRALGMANAYTALSEDPAALYFNPAGLARVGGSYAGVSFVLTQPSLSATTPDPHSLNLAAYPGDTEYGFHFAWNPKGLLSQRLGLGFSVLLPHRRALSFQVHRLEDPYFVLYENSVQLLEIRLGAAFKIFDWLQVGFSALLLGGLDGKVSIAAPIQLVSDPKDADPTKRTVVTMDVFLPNREFFTLGIQAQPIQGLSLGVTYRDATFVPVALPIDFMLNVGTSPFPVVAGLDVRVKYAPREVAFGVAYQLLDELLLSLDLTWAEYSQYVLPFASVNLNMSNAFVLLSPNTPVIGFRDILIPRIGAEWKAIGALTVRGGYGYADSFITSTENPIIDSVKHTFTLGLDYALDEWLFDPKESPDSHLDLVASGMLVHYTARHVSSYDSSGDVFSTVFGAEMRY